MNFKYFYFKLLQNQIRLMSSNKPKNHYDSLGISSKSTQGEVKSAYYKLSMLYHPDKSQNSAESSQKFRDISEAYEVLGNVRTRKLYDRGLHFGGSATATTYPEDKFHKSRETRSRPPPPTGKTPIYDFDDWSRNHYGATFQRQMNHKRKQRMTEMRRQQDIYDIKMEQLVFAIGTFLLICMYIIKTSSNRNDNVTWIGSNVVRTKKVPDD